MNVFYIVSGQESPKYQSIPETHNMEVMMTQGNGYGKLTVLDEITSRLAQMTTASYVPPTREPKRSDKVVGVCSSHIMALYTLGNEIVESTRPAAEEINAIQRELQEKIINVVDDIPSLFEALTDDLRVKAKRQKELEASVKPANRMVDLMNKLLGAEIERQFPETLDTKAVIDSNWQVVVPANDSDPLSELAAMFDGMPGRGMRTGRGGH